MIDNRLQPGTDEPEMPVTQFASESLVAGSPPCSAALDLKPLVKELRALADGWRNSPSDPHNTANAVMVALLEVSNAIVQEGKQ